MTKSKSILVPLGQSLAPQQQHQQQQQQQRPLRKNVWTRDKIARLICLYRQNECLWNNYIEAYKNKERRRRAIEDICTRLRISKLDFGKKIHNLRNQFNSEMKKIERRLDESAGSGSGGEREEIRSRWDHYESLLFLKDVIAPRPGYQISGNWNHQRNRQSKIEQNQQQQHLFSDDDDAGTSHIKSIIANDDDDDEAENAADVTQENDPIGEESEYHYEETVPDEEAELADQESAVDQYMTNQAAVVERSEDVIDQKYNPSATMREVIITSLPESTSVAGKTYYTTTVQHHNHHQSDHQIPKTTQRQLLSKAITTTPTPQNIRPIVKQIKSPCSPPAEVNRPASIRVHSGTKRGILDSFQASSVASRDEWDSFGEMVAAEFRNLNTDMSRKKLKRKIMQAMLEVGEADDGISINIPIN